MHAFTYERATDLGRARSAVAAGAVALAGGTDLLPLLRGRLLAPDVIVDISATDGSARGITDGPDGSLRLGGLTTLAEIGAHPRVLAEHAALAQAAASAATPQIRNVATIGGNLCQWNRCWYFRGGIPCHLTGGDSCPAAAGDNRHHAIFAEGPCIAVHPSDPAVALVALGARVEIEGPAGHREMPAADFLHPARPGSPDQTALAPGELITAVVLPRQDGVRSLYVKAMDRKVWAFALASVAVAIQIEAAAVLAARIVLGGVAGRPHIAAAAAEALIGGPLDEAAVDRAASAAVTGARPLAHNAYKLDLTRGLVRAALTDLMA